jgi:cell division septum initiation protein DivIVA
MPSDDITKLLKERSLPVVMRGYDRKATDDLLNKVEAGLKSLLSEHSDAQARVIGMEKRVAEARKREEAVTEALSVAARVRADSEREGNEIKSKYVREAESIAAEGKRKADEALRAAQAQAEKIFEDARLRARGLEQEIRDAEQIAERTRARLTSFLESLLGDIEHRGADLAAAVDDLFARAGDAGESGRARPPG